MITNNVSTLKIHKLTQEQYNRALESNNIDENALYLTPDETLDSAKEYTDKVTSGKADLEHNHTIDEVADLQTSLDSKADLEHTHTIKNITNLQSTLDNKSDVTHNHDSDYDEKGASSSALISAKEYADGLIADEVTDRNSAIATAKSSAISTASSDATTKSNNTLASAKSYTDTKVANLASTSTVDNKISTHNTSTSAHSDIRALITELSTKVSNFLDVDDTTTDQLSEVITLIENNKGTLESLTSSKVNVSDIVNNLTTTSTSKVLSANQGVVLKGLIDDLVTVVAGKSDIGHTHTVSHAPAGTVAETSITPSGTVTSTFTGTAASHNHSFTGTKATISADYTPEGTVASTFTGSSATSGSPSGTSTVASSTHTHKYTPSGTISAPTFTGSSATTAAPSGTTSVYSITGVGSVPSLTAAVANQCLTLTFGAGSVPTRSSVTLPSTSHTHTVTAKGSVSAPTFTGTEASTTSISGTTSVASSGHTHSVTAKGSVASTFTGADAAIETEYTPAGTVANKSVTPVGTISSTFKGTAASHKHTFTGTVTTLTTSEDN